MKIIQGKFMKNEMRPNESLDSEGLDTTMLQMIEAYQALQKTKNTSEQPINILKEKATEIDTTIIEVLKKAANDMVVHFKKETTRELRACIQASLHNPCVELNKMIDDAKCVKHAQDKEISLLWQCIIGAAILFCVLGGILGGLTVHYFMPEVTPQLQQRLNHASLIENAWPQLSKKEQDRFKAIAEGKAMHKLDKKSKKA